MRKCLHHWLIDKPNGPLSRGRCKKCREERYFVNTPPDIFDQQKYRKAKKRELARV